MSDIKVYFDKNGSFLMQLIKGAQRGYDVGDKMSLMKKVAGGIDKAKEILRGSRCGEDVYSPVNVSDKETDLFPCVIVVKKSLLTEWDKAEERRWNRYDRIKKIYEYLLLQNKADGLWPVNYKYVLSEMERIQGLRKKIQSDNVSLQKNLKSEFSFFNNSSIWIRLVDWNVDELSDAWDELMYFKNIGLFNYGSAQESLGYNVRIQKENYLKTPFGGHGVFVTPEIYGDEVEAKKILVGNSSRKL